MRFLIVDTYYPAFLKRAYAETLGLKGAAYSDQMDTLLGCCFGTSDFYSFNLRALGHEAADVVVNCTDAQAQWAREFAPHLRRPGGRRWELAVLTAQVEHYRPDVLYVQDMTYLQPRDIFDLRNHVGVVAGQTAYTIDWRWDYRVYDIVFSSFPHYVDRFMQQGIATAYVPLGFDPRVLERVGPQEQDLDVVFVGGISPTHRDATALLNQVAREIPVDVWGYVTGPTEGLAPLLSRYHGEAWGLEMYRVLGRSRVVLNRHSATAQQYANNMRLFEATGMGGCLVTDSKSNLAELFVVGEEVVDYSTAGECVDAIRHLLREESEREAIAGRGQARTLQHHTYRQRMAQLAELVEDVVSHGGGAARRPRSRRLPTMASTARTIAARLLRPLLRRRSGDQASAGYEAIAAADVGTELLEGWRSEAIPAAQRQLVERELADMRAGRTPHVFRVAAEAVQATGLVRPSIAELGCASGYYAEALGFLLGPIDYLGFDYSEPLLRTAHAHYPDLGFAISDAGHLPVREAAVDIAFSSSLILHLLDYETAITETARICRGYGIFHRTPVVHAGPTVLLRKRAYGIPVMEMVFNERELKQLFERAGFQLMREIVIDSYRVPDVDGEVFMTTYVLEKR